MSGFPGIDNSPIKLVALADINGSPTWGLSSVNVSPGNALSVTPTVPIIFDMIDGGSTVNSNIWNQSTSGMTITQSSGLINVNGGLATTANAYAILSSVKQSQNRTGAGLVVGFNVQVNTFPEANATIEFGLGSVATNAAPTDGVFFRISVAGIQCVMNYNGVETTSPPLGPPTPGSLYDFVIIISDNQVLYLQGLSGVGASVIFAIPVPNTQQAATLNSRQPVFGRVYNGASPPGTAPQLKIGGVAVQLIDTFDNKQWRDISVGLGRGSYQDISAFTQTANHANSSSPTSATLSNTAAGYTTLGGRYQFAAPAGAATDFALFAYQVPAGFQLYITDIAVSSINTGAAVATTATILDWSAGLNSSAVSLATTDSSTTTAPRRVPLGTQGFVVGAAIGAGASDVVRNFDTPLVVDSGRYLHIIVQIPVGTATGSQVVRGDVTINGYFE